MNREETKKAIEVMQAYVDGEQIEAKQEGCEWRASFPIWDWGPNEYRVKQEPLECWVTVYNDHLPSTVHTSKEGALKVATTVPGPAPPSVDKGWTVRKFREVIE